MLTAIGATFWYSLMRSYIERVVSFRLNERITVVFIMLNILVREALYKESLSLIGSFGLHTTPRHGTDSYMRTPKDSSLSISTR
jgi:hypothetical protein